MEDKDFAEALSECLCDNVVRHKLQDHGLDFSWRGYCQMREDMARTIREELKNAGLPEHFKKVLS
jgi:hypothetical protein